MIGRCTHLETQVQTATSHFTHVQCRTMGQLNFPYMKQTCSQSCDFPPPRLTYSFLCLCLMQTSLLGPHCFHFILSIVHRFYGMYKVLSHVLSQSKHIHFELDIIYIKITPPALLQSNQKKEKQMTKWKPRYVPWNE